MVDTLPTMVASLRTRGYQQEMLEESFKKNIIIALDTGSGKTHIAILRIKAEVEREPVKVGPNFQALISRSPQIIDICMGRFPGSLRRP